MKNIILLILSLLTVTEVSGQNFIYNFDRISVKADSIIDFYEISKNPALLNQDKTDERLQIKSYFNTGEEKFKRYFTPSATDLYQVEFSGKKTIDGNQIFKGSFGFNKLVRKEWSWVFSKDFDSGNPFLLGDNSTGNSVFNGIYFDANYSNQVSKKLTLGAGIQYLVDEGLKQVSPKPTSRHRDIIYRLGTSYQLIKTLQLGFAVNIRDQKEEITYREDEGAVYKEIMVMKFRGLDFPVIVRKKTENRTVFYNNYEFNNDIIFSPSKTSCLFFNLKKGIEQTISRDEITNPTNQGKFLNDYLITQIKYEQSITTSLKSVSGLNYMFTDFWSKHPDYSVLLSEGKQRFYSLSQNFSYKFNPFFSLTFGGGYGEFHNKLNDYYSDVFYDVYKSIYSVTSGFDWSIFEQLKLRGSLSLEKFQNTKTEVNTSQNSYYYFYAFQKDVDYFLSDFLRFNSAVTIVYYTRIGDFIFNIGYEFLRPGKNTKFYNQNNTEINTFFEYRVKIY